MEENSFVKHDAPTMVRMKTIFYNATHTIGERNMKYG